MTPSKGTLIQFINCKLLRKHTIICEDLWVRNGKIVDPFNLYFEENTIADIVIDCKGYFIAPSFIDVQINGAFGVDFSKEDDDVEKGIEKVSQGLLSHGVTSFCPTLITSPSTHYHKCLPRICKCPGTARQAGILGVHVEGPFISQEKPGAHPPNLIKKFDNGFSDLEKMYGALSNICLVTLAPELPHALDVIKELNQRGVTVSLGHSVANLAEGELAVQNGATFITHLFNAMLPFHHRDPGLVGLLASDNITPKKTIFYGIIADGIHTHPAALRIAYRTNPKGLILVTDAISSMGLPKGIHHVGQQVVEIKDNSAYVMGTNILCGSIATMNECVKTFKKATNCTSVEALECASLHPAQLLGIEHQKGNLNFGCDADFVILDNELNVLATYINGQCAWKKYSDEFLNSDHNKI